MLVILDGAERQAFCRPLRHISADIAADLPAGLAAIEEALAQGHHVAGWLGYELGHALAPRLAARAGTGPLLRRGVFDGRSDAPPVLGRALAGSAAPEWNQDDYTARCYRVKD